MDADKLNEAMLRAWCQYLNMEYVPDFVNPLPSEIFERGFKQGVNYLMQQPLADRLTEEEKERIKKLYLTDEEIEGIKTAFGRYPVAAATISKNMLEQIFGKELFNEK